MTNRLQRAGKAIRFLLVTIGSALLRRKGPKPPQSVNSLAELEAYLNKLVAFGTPPSLSLAVTKDGAIVYNKAFGLADGPNGVAATPETVYHWWSLSKIVTAIAIVQLHERGSLSIHDEVSAHLPFFKVQYPSDGSERITIRHLLNHSSGLPDLQGQFDMFHMEGESPPDQAALVKKALSDDSRLKFFGAQAFAVERVFGNCIKVGRYKLRQGIGKFAGGEAITLDCKANLSGTELGDVS